MGHDMGEIRDEEYRLSRNDPSNQREIIPGIDEEHHDLFHTKFLEDFATRGKDLSVRLDKPLLAKEIYDAVVLVNDKTGERSVTWMAELLNGKHVVIESSYMPGDSRIVYDAGLQVRSLEDSKHLGGNYSQPLRVLHKAGDSVGEVYDAICNELID